MGTILLVEDDLANRTVIEDMFEFDGLGTELECVTSAEEALVLAPRLQPTLILMDIRLPGISGLEATRRLKKDPRTGSLVIWALTAYAMTEDSAKALAAGCDRYITKPFDSGVLRDCLREFIGRHPQPAAEALSQVAR